MPNVEAIHIVGGGLAGAEAAWQVAHRNIPVIIHEMRPIQGTEAHVTDLLAELVCSNSFRSDDAQHNAIGLLHKEMRLSNSIVMTAGDSHRVPAGSAMAVDRVGFSRQVQTMIENHPLIEIIRGEVVNIPLEEWGSTIVASGPLTSPTLAESIQKIIGEDYLAFFDAIAPIVHRETINMDVAWFQSRYDKSTSPGKGGDYINCPMTKETYTSFIAALLDADTVKFKEWEKNTPYFESCLPIEVMAQRGIDTLRWGPLKPVGLTNPRAPNQKPWAIAQLRQDNALGTLFNMVGFQTKLKHDMQVQIFRTIPGLESAQFARLGGIHRNTFINSPKLLDRQLRLKHEPRLRFAGQITGVEGYVESAAIGILAGKFAAAEKQQEIFVPPPPNTALGSLLNHITCGANAQTFQPMNINFGLFPPLKEKTKKELRKRSYTTRASLDFASWQN